MASKHGLDLIQPNLNIDVRDLHLSNYCSESLTFFFFQLCKPLYRGAAWMSFTGITIAEGEPQLILT